mmetsp:Transcript_4549/g.6818  ORF Transcript_4549/g.6818 Transcript_4549/m.6818 type:complete len:340 (+) Transcript_4549:165-1184(+)
MFHKTWWNRKWETFVAEFVANDNFQDSDPADLVFKLISDPNIPSPSATTSHSDTPSISSTPEGAPTTISHSPNLDPTKSQYHTPSTTTSCSNSPSKTLSSNTPSFSFSYSHTMNTPSNTFSSSTASNIPSESTTNTVNFQGTPSKSSTKSITIPVTPGIQVTPSISAFSSIITSSPTITASQRISVGFPASGTISLRLVGNEFSPNFSRTPSRENQPIPLPSASGGPITSKSRTGPEQTITGATQIVNIPPQEIEACSSGDWAPGSICGNGGIVMAPVVAPSGDNIIVSWPNIGEINQSDVSNNILSIIADLNLSSNQEFNFNRPWRYSSNLFRSSGWC